MNTTTRTPIPGCRHLSQPEIDPINEVKAHAETTRELVAQVQGYIDPAPHFQVTNPCRRAVMATSDLQTGRMKPNRASAQPTAF